jgi:hypothetical protein
LIEDHLRAVGIAASIVVGVIFLQACPPARPVVAAPTDASDAAPAVDDGPLDDEAPSPMAYQTACAHLRTAGCREGTISNCPRVLAEINADPHFTHYNLVCLSTADGASAVRRCGVDCTP